MCLAMQMMSNEFYTVFRWQIIMQLVGKLEIKSPQKIAKFLHEEHTGRIHPWIKMDSHKS